MSNLLKLLTKIWRDPVLSQVIGNGIIIAISCIAAVIFPNVRGLLLASSPIPNWVALLFAALLLLAIILPMARWSKPKITLIDVDQCMAATSIPFRLKVYCEMRNDSNRPIDVRVDNYISKEVKVRRITPGALQLKFQPGSHWLPDSSVERVAVLPGQTFRAWIAPDEALFNKESFERLRSQMGKGQIGTLILNVNAQKFPMPL